jgi:hypothetical protein
MNILKLEVDISIPKQGYQGMVDGGDHIELAEWKTVSNMIQKVFPVLLSSELNLYLLVSCNETRVYFGCELLQNAEHPGEVHNESLNCFGSLFFSDFFM